MKTIRVIIIIFCMAIAGCDIFLPEEPDQKYLFDVYYVNYAWGFTLNGIYVDIKGDVYSYEASFRDISPDSIKVFTRRGKAINEKDLEQKFSFHKKFIKNIDASRVRKKYVDIYRVPVNANSDTTNTGADMGAFVHSCYRYNNKINTYEEVVLKVTGDQSYYNTSKAAADLLEWLDSEVTNK